jgi:exosortase/archaeosortase family protein
MVKRGKSEKKVNEILKEDNKKETKKRTYLLRPIRYLILLAMMFSMPIIYWIFTPMTIYLSAFLLKIFFSQVSVYQNFLSINSNIFIQLIPACIAGSAYLLLLILNLSVPMKIKTRICSILFSFLILLLLNVIRISLLAFIYKENLTLFNTTHMIFWYFLSTIFVIGIWFLTVKIFSIKEIPIYSDIKSLIKDINFRN